MTLALIFLFPLIAGIISLYPGKSSFRTSLAFGVFILLCGAALKILLEPLPQILLVGGWPHFAGITWIADATSLLFVWMGILAFFPAAFLLRHSTPSKNAFFYFMVAATLGIFLTGDLFNLYVLFEILLVSTYVLFYEQDPRQSRVRVYFWMNLLGSILFLAVIALFYQRFQTLNLMEISIRWEQLSSDVQIALFSLLSLVFLIKAAIFPAMIWVPTSYLSFPKEILPFAAVLSTKIGIYALLRVGLWVVPATFSLTAGLFQTLALITLAISMLGILGSKQFLQSLLWINVAHTGLVLLMMSIPHSIQNLGVYLLYDSVTMAGLFTLALELPSDENERRGFWQNHRWLSLGFLVLALQLVGLPPSVGFFAEWKVFRIFSSAHRWDLALIAVALIWVSWMWFWKFWLHYFVGPSLEVADERPHWGKPFSITTYFIILAAILSALCFFNTEKLDFPNDSSLIDRLQFETEHHSRSAFQKEPEVAP